MCVILRLADSPVEVLSPVSPFSPDQTPLDVESQQNGGEGDEQGERGEQRRRRVVVGAVGALEGPAHVADVLVEQLVGVVQRDVLQGCE